MKNYYFYRLRNEYKIGKFVGIKELKNVDSYNNVVAVENEIISRNINHKWHCPFIIEANSRDEMINKVLENYKEEDNILFQSEDNRSIYSYDVKFFYEIEDEVVRVRTNVRDSLNIIKLAEEKRKIKEYEIVNSKVYYTL